MKISNKTHFGAERGYLLFIHLHAVIVICCALNVYGPNCAQVVIVHVELVSSEHEYENTRIAETVNGIVHLLL